MDGDAEGGVHAFPDEEDVVNLAGLWSINPLDLSDLSGEGLLGVLPLA